MLAPNQLLSSALYNDQIVSHSLLHNEHTGQLAFLGFHLLRQVLAPRLKSGVQLGQAFEFGLPSDRLINMCRVVEMYQQITADFTQK